MTYQEFVEAALRQPETLRILLTDTRPTHGIRSRGAREVRLLGPKAIDDSNLAEAFRRRGVDYWDPMLGWLKEAFELSADEMVKALESVTSVPGFKNGAFQEDHTMSIRLISNGEEDPMAFEALMDSSQAKQALGALFSAMIHRDELVEGLTHVMAYKNLFPLQSPQDVTDSVSYTLGPVRNVGGHLEGWLEVTNTSGSDLPAPFSILFPSRKESPHVIGPLRRGMILREWISQPRESYYDLDVGESFTPGESIRVTLGMRTGAKIRLRPRFLAGEGVR